MGVFEARYRKDMEVDEAKELVADAIRAGIFNDLGSGSNVDICVITKGKVQYIRPYSVENERGARFNDFLYKPGTTAVLTEIIKPVVVSELVLPLVGAAAAQAQQAGEASAALPEATMDL